MSVDVATSRLHKPDALPAEGLNVRNATDRLGKAFADTANDIGRGVRDHLPLAAAIAAAPETGGASLLPTIASMGMGAAAGSGIRRLLGGGDTTIDPASEAADAFVTQGAIPAAATKTVELGAPIVKRLAGAAWDAIAGAPKGTGSSVVLPSGHGVLLPGQTPGVREAVADRLPEGFKLTRSAAEDAHAAGVAKAGGLPQLIKDATYGGGAGAVLGRLGMGPLGSVVTAGRMATNPIVASASAQGAHSLADLALNNPKTIQLSLQALLDRLNSGGQK